MVSARKKAAVLSTSRLENATFCYPPPPPTFFFFFGLFWFVLFCFVSCFYILNHLLQNTWSAHKIFNTASKNGVTLLGLRSGRVQKRVPFFSDNTSGAFRVLVDSSLAIGSRERMFPLLQAPEKCERKVDRDCNFNEGGGESVQSKSRCCQLPVLSTLEQKEKKVLVG